MTVENPKRFTDLVGFQPVMATDPSTQEIHGTTVIALCYDQGVLTLADRRATMGNLIMYDKAEKVFALDDHTVVAISGSFARSLEICRMLKHSFKYFRRMHLQEMSLEGKLQEISKALAANLGSVLNGIGVFLPIVSAYDPSQDRFSVHSFDTAGARFELGSFGAAGSGSERIRGVFEYIKQEKGPWGSRTRKQVLEDGVRLLDLAATLDSATGGISKALPIVRDLTAKGTRALTEDELRPIVEKIRTLD